MHWPIDSYRAEKKSLVPFTLIIKCYAKRNYKQRKREREREREKETEIDCRMKGTGIKAIQ